MTNQSLLVLLSLVAMIILLIRGHMRPGMILFSFAILLMVVGVITPEEVISGFNNKGMITVAILFLVSEGVRQTGALNSIIGYILPSNSKGGRYSYIKMLPPIAIISAFLNNTAVVVIFAPMVKKWANMMKIPATKFLIPLSYATILGGTCTLIGTSTNLVIHGMMIDYGYEGFSMFELGKVGIFVTVIGIIYIVIFGNFLLPGNNRNEQEITDKEYYYDVNITENSRFIGEKIINNELSRIPLLKVTKLNREGKIIEIKNRYLKAGDIVSLKGTSESTERLLYTEGLILNCLSKLDKSFIKNATCQVEAIIAPRFQGINQKLGDYDFFRHYGGVVIAINRLGEKITTNLEKHVLKEGDNLIILTDENFIKSWGESSMFYLVSRKDDFIAPTEKKGRFIVIGLLIFMVAGTILGENLDKISIYFTDNTISYHFPSLEDMRFDMFYFAAITMIIMAWLNFFPQSKYTKFVSWDILIAIASAFAISKAMINSGMAALVAQYLIDMSANLGPYGVLAALYIITNICTEVVTNNAAAALGFPIAIAISEQLNVSPYPFFVAITIAASASFSTPIGYQTNLIVQAIGNYKFKDYIRIGLPLNIIAFLIAIFVIPLFWKF